MKRLLNFIYSQFIDGSVSLLCGGLLLLISIFNRETTTAICGATLIIGICLLKIGIAIQERKSAEPQTKPPQKPIFKPKEPQETEEQRKQRILDENVERYDGSGRNQVKIT